MRLLSIPAALIGIVVAILFFKVYGLVTRPEVPQPVAFVVSRFAPGVEIGAKVSDAKRAVAAMTYVPHLGFVGLPGSSRSIMPYGMDIPFVQVRLLLDEATRALPNPNPNKSPIDAVEVVTAMSGVSSELNPSLLMVFRRIPRQGCLRTSTEGRFRQVDLWTTPNDRGGIAVIADFGGNPASRVPGPMITNIIAFAGPFDGSRTLRGDYVDASCTTLVASQ
jgi:hypothetical protein